MILFVSSKQQDDVGMWKRLQHNNRFILLSVSIILLSILTFWCTPRPSGYLQLLWKSNITAMWMCWWVQLQKRPFHPFASGCSLSERTKHLLFKKTTLFDCHLVAKRLNCIISNDSPQTVVGFLRCPEEHLEQVELEKQQSCCCHVVCMNHIKALPAQVFLLLFDF